MEIKHAQDDNDFAVREGNNAGTSWNTAGAVKGRREGGRGEQVGLARCFNFHYSCSDVCGAFRETTSHGERMKTRGLDDPDENVTVRGMGRGGEGWGGGARFRLFLGKIEQRHEEFSSVALNCSVESTAELLEQLLPREAWFSRENLPGRVLSACGLRSTLRQVLWHFNATNAALSVWTAFNVVGRGACVFCSIINDISFGLKYKLNYLWYNGAKQLPQRCN